MSVKDSPLNRGALHHVGTGYVVENMNRPTNVVKAFPIEQLSDFSGVIPNADQGSEKKKKGRSRSGGGGASPMGMGKEHWLEAAWLGGGDTHQVTSPYARKGMKVSLYRLGTTDRYYWSMDHNELGLRKKDYSLHAWSNLKDRTPDGSEVDKDDHLKTALEKGRKRKDATVFIVDQEKGFIELTTPNNDKEKNSFTYKIDMKKGTMNLGNSRGSAFNIDAAKGIWDISVKTIKMKATDVSIKGDTIEIDGETTFKKPVTFEDTVEFEMETEFLAKATMNSLTETDDGAKVL